MFVQVVARIATILQSVTLLNGFSFEKCDADHTLKSGLKKSREAGLCRPRSEFPGGDR